MTIDDFTKKLRAEPREVQFSDTMSVIEAHYVFTPTAFTNGEVENAAGENSGSCKLFSFAVLQGLTKEETLACFGPIYFEEVLGDPEGTGHQNIRNFMKSGFQGLTIHGEALKPV